jgi:DNA-directed RNA polymerase subunit F
MQKKPINFTLTKEDVFKDNPEFMAVPEFAGLTERQMRYVMLVDWFGSPLRLMKLEDRKFKAAVMSGYKLERDGKRLDMNGRNLVNGKTTSVEAARKVMRSIQYDSERELYNALNIQIEQIVNFFKIPEKSADELAKAVTLMTKLPTILETRNKILGILNFREEDIVSTTIEETITQEEGEFSELDKFIEEENE